MAATNKNLEAEIVRGAFREDLYYRINVIPLIVPPFGSAGRTSPSWRPTSSRNWPREQSTPTQDFQPPGHGDALAAQPWPGNVRELKNFLWRLAIMIAGTTIEVADLPPARPGPYPG